MRQRPSASPAIRSAVSSKPACCPPHKLCRTPLIKSAQATCIRKPSAWRSPEKGARVAPNLRSRFQCFQILENEVHNESPIAIRRNKLLEFFALLSPCLVGLEACGSAHHWARELMKLGHDARMMPPAYVKPYIRGRRTTRRTRRRSARR